MMTRRHILLLMLIVVVGSWPTAVGSGQHGDDPGQTEIASISAPELLNGPDALEPTLAIVGGWLIDGTGRIPYADAVVLIAGDKIVAVGPRARLSIPPQVEIIDARGKTILPGIIDAHNHLEGIGLGDDDRELVNTPEKLKQAILQNAQLDLQSGVTTIRDMGSSNLVLQMRQQIEAVGPRLFAAGQQLIKKSSDAPALANCVEFDGVREARSRTRELIAKGVDLIKVRLVAQRPLPTLEELKAIIRTAREANLKVAVHTDVPHEQAVRLAIDAGADSLEHSAVLRANNDLLLRQMARQNMILVPTLFQLQAQQLDPLMRSDDELIESPLAELLPAEWLSALKQRAAVWRKNMEDWRTIRQYDPQRALRDAFNAVVRAHSIGVKMALGPDTGSDLVPHGRIYRDIEFYISAGLPVMDVIQMYTKNGAEVLGKEKILGTIEPGKLADIILLDSDATSLHSDPAFDRRAFRRVSVVIKNGKVVKNLSASTTELGTR
ncbi:MAG: amidohydrolase family protein [Acidobacteriota bacterium]|nr:amidohydrolase family protein [Blastocatellia bacterium]MDW8241241.1 amidohydrolase family protein [Acidobacteriota bacterium]